MSTGKPGRGSDQFPLRLPDGMRDRLKAAADDNSRSMNAEIVARLEWYEAQGKGLEELTKEQTEAQIGLIKEQTEQIEALKGIIKEQTEALNSVMEATEKLGRAKDVVIATQDILLEQREILIDHLKSQGKSICQIGIGMANAIIAEADKLPLQEVNKTSHFLNALTSISALYGSAGYDDAILKWASRSEDSK